MRPRHVATAMGVTAVVLAGARRLPRFRPLLLLARLSPRSRSRAQKLLFKAGYYAVNRFISSAEIGFLNYGYAPIDERVEQLELSPESEVDRYGIQLYDKIVGAVSLRGLDVLEVGCGRGGGAAFVFERREPRTMTGLDLSARAIETCRRRYARPGLRFVAGDAERLPFPDASVDAVVNVESSHCYPSMDRFLAEVTRVLRPGGMLLFADLRATRNEDAGDEPGRADVARLRSQIAAAGLVVVDEEDITANVVRALALNSPRMRALIERRAPNPIRSEVLNFAAVEGSATYRSFETRELSYLRMILRPAPDATDAAAVAAESSPSP